MFSYTVMVIDLIDPVDFPHSSQHGQHSQQPCVDRSAGKNSVTPPATPKTLTDVNASRVPELVRAWKNLELRACSNFDVGVVCHIINIPPTGRIIHEADVILVQNELFAPIACYGACHRFACCKQRRFFTKTGYVPSRFGHKVFIFSFKFCGLMPTVDCLKPSGLFSDAQIIVSPTPARQHQAQYQDKTFHLLFLASLIERTSP